MNELYCVQSREKKRKIEDVNASCEEMAEVRYFGVMPNQAIA